MNLSDLTQYVWNQTDTTEYDLPATTIAQYVDEAFNRTIAAENRWPFYEHSWEVVVSVGESTASLPTDMNVPAVMSVTHKERGYKLQQISQEEADRKFGSDLMNASIPNPPCYSFWGRTISFWPQTAAAEDTAYVVRGYRRPSSTFGQDGQVDADARLHRPLAHYAVALAYAQQEDETLEDKYMERWQRDVEMARQAIMDPAHNRPVVMYGNFPRTPVGGARSLGAWP